MNEYIYFDNAATTLPKPEAVYKFMDEFFRTHGVNPGRSGYELAIEAEIMISQTRAMLAHFFGYSGDPSRVTFSMNATDSINTALLGLVQPGDHMIITRTEHNAVLRPTNFLEQDRNVEVTRVPADGNGYVDPQEFLQNMQRNTRAVVVNHASNVTGSLQDIKTIGEIVRNSDATFIVDTCQTAGIVPIDMDRIGIDILVYTGHKGLFGPSGIGGMIVSRDTKVKRLRSGGTGFRSELPLHPEEYPYHLEAGTLSIPGIAGLHAAQKWFAELGHPDGSTRQNHYEACRTAVESIHTRELKITQQLIDAFSVIDNVTIYGPTGSQSRVPTLSINIGSLPADQVGSILDADHGICVRTGLHCAPMIHQDQNTLHHNGTVRFSPGFFTEDAAIRNAIDAVQIIAECQSV